MGEAERVHPRVLRLGGQREGSRVAAGRWSDESDRDGQRVASESRRRPKTLSAMAAIIAVLAPVKARGTSSRLAIMGDAIVALLACLLAKLALISTPVRTENI